MASHPDANPDSDPSGPSDSPEQVTPPDPVRENIEDTPEEYDRTAETGDPVRMGDPSLTP